MPFGHKTIRDLDDKKLLERISEDFERAKSAKSDAHTRCERLKNIYEALDPPEEQIDEASGKVEEDKGANANVYLPVGAAVADAGVAKLFNFIFSDEDYFRIFAKDSEDNLFAHKITQHMKSRHREMKYRIKVHGALQQAVCYDFCVGGFRWLLRPGYEPRRQKEVTYKQYGNIRMPFQRVTMEDMWIPDAVDRPDMFVLDYFRSYPDPNATGGFDDSEFFIDERDIKIEELVNNAQTKDKPWGKYKNITKVLKKIKESLPENPTPEAVERVYPGRRVKVIRYWTPDQVVEQCMDEVIWRKNLSGWPLQLWKIEDKPMQFPGMGLLQRMERNLMDINASMNARRNYQNLVSDPWVVMDQSLLAQFQGSPRMYAGKVIASSGGNPKDKIYVYQPGQNVAQDTMSDVGVQIEMTERQSGISQNDQAVYASGRRSATETAKVSAGADMRAFKISRKIEEAAIEPGLMEHFKLEQANMTTSERFTYFGRYGEEMVGINPSDYRWNRLPNFLAMGSLSMANDAVDNAQFLQVLEFFMKIPSLPVDWIEAANEMVRRYSPRMIGKLIKDPNEPEVNVPADMENYLASQGLQLVVSKLNDQARHMAIHNAIKKTTDYELWPKAFQNKLEAHIMEHQNALQQVVSVGSAVAGPSQDGADALRGIRPTALRAGP